MDIRIGNGFDVHAVIPGYGMTLAGINIPCDLSLVGHSDADVVLHALTDAILGAASLGDIGQHFPPTDQKWKGADSTMFLIYAQRLALDKGFTIGNIDITVIGESPKIAPHRDAMRKNISDVMQIEVSRVSIKATTTEKLGFTGRGEGLACMATVLLIAR